MTDNNDNTILDDELDNNNNASYKVYDDDDKYSFQRAPNLSDTFDDASNIASQTIPDTLLSEETEGHNVFSARRTSPLISGESRGISNDDDGGNIFRSRGARGRLSPSFTTTTNDTAVDATPVSKRPVAAIPTISNEVDGTPNVSPDASLDSAIASLSNDDVALNPFAQKSKKINTEEAALYEQNAAASLAAEASIANEANSDSHKTFITIDTGSNADILVEPLHDDFSNIGGKKSAIMHVDDDHDDGASDDSTAKAFDDDNVGTLYDSQVKESIIPFIAANKSSLEDEGDAPHVIDDSGDKVNDADDAPYQKFTSHPRDETLINDDNIAFTDDGKTLENLLEQDIPSLDETSDNMDDHAIDTASYNAKGAFSHTHDAAHININGEDVDYASSRDHLIESLQHIDTEAWSKRHLMSIPDEPIFFDDAPATLRDEVAQTQSLPMLRNFLMALGTQDLEHIDIPDQPISFDEHILQIDGLDIIDTTDSDGMNLSSKLMVFGDNDNDELPTPPSLDEHLESLQGKAPLFYAALNNRNSLTIEDMIDDDNFSRFIAGGRGRKHPFEDVGSGHDERRRSLHNYDDADEQIVIAEEEF